MADTTAGKLAWIVSASMSGGNFPTYAVFSASSWASEDTVRRVALDGVRE